MRGMKRNNIDKCRNLRKNQTDAERKLWLVLRNRQLEGTKFRRQFPIGRYILDFYSPECKIGIEANGSQHYETQGRKKDELRAKELSKYGIEILRFSDLDILNNIEGVYETIVKTVKDGKGGFPSSFFSPKGRSNLQKRGCYGKIKINN